MMPEDHPVTDGLSAEDRELLAHLVAQGGAGSDQPVRVAHEEATPLSLAQRQLWVLEQLRPGDPAYHISVAFAVLGPLDPAALALALSDVVSRHEILRTTFPVRDDEPWQRVHPPSQVPLPCDEMIGAGDEAVAAAAAAESRAPFDLVRGPLLRARVFRQAADRHVLVLTMHHLVSDGWSMDVLYREMAAAYTARRDGRVPVLPELPVQYRDFAIWQRRHLQGRGLDRLAGYWRRRLDGVTSLALPTDRMRAGTADSAGAQEICRLDRRELIAIDALAREERATRFMALLAAFTAFLARYAGSLDVVVGTPLAGRDRAAVAPLIGYFVNLLPLRVTLTPRTTYRELLRQVRDATLGAYEHQDLPLSLIEQPSAAAVPGGQPPFGVTFSAQDVLARPPELGGVRLVPIPTPVDRSRFDLEGHVFDDPAGVRVSFVYRRALFDPPTVRRMLGHYVSLLRACVADPDARVLAQPMLSADERDDLLVRRNATARRHAPGRVAALIAAQAAAAPDRAAVTDGTRTLTFGDLDRGANRWAHWLRARGLEDEQRVGVLIDRSVDLPLALLAVLRAGGAYVPLDPTYPAARLSHLIEDAGVTLVLTTRRHAGVLPDGRRLVVCLDDEDVGAASCPEAPPDIAIESDQLAYVVYTSGSTGTPKGVAVPHAGLENLVHWHNRAFAVSAADRATLVASVGFDASVWELWPYLAVGASLHVVDDDLRGTPDRLWACLRDERITIAFLPTPLAEAVLREERPEDLPLRVLLTGGDRLGTGLRGPWSFSLVNNYGPTESTVVSTSGTVEPAEGSVLPSIGRPVDNVQVYVLDADMLPQPVGVVGELYVGGESLARGYLGRPGQTAARFVPNPFSTLPGARLYRTGDLVRWRQDGALDFVGRDDAQVKVRGFRIELGEVEAALAALPGVRAAAATVRETGSERRLIGYVVPDGRAVPDVAGLRERLRGIVPAYMVPAALVAIESLPLSAHGKVDRRALPEPVIEPVSDGGLPASPVEHALAGIWAEVLRLDRVGIHDNFFDLGGDSVLSIQIASRAARAGIRLSPGHFFEHQTIAELAAASADAAHSRVASAPAAGPVPLTPTQRWFLEQDQPEPDHFCQTVVLEAPGVPVDAVRTALDVVLARHSVFRSRFHRTGHGWAQELADAHAAVEWATEDLSRLPALERPAAIDRAAVRLQSGLRIGDGRFVAAAWFTPGGGDAPLLLITIHHLVVDAVSWRVLMEDLAAVTRALVAGRPVLLPEPTTDFHRWAQTIDAASRAAAFADESEFWARQERPDATPLPLDVAPAAAAGLNTVGGAATVAVSLDAEETRTVLRDVSRLTGARLHEVLLAAVAAAVHAWVGGSAIRIDVEGHGRGDVLPDVDLSRSVGWFTVVYPIAVPFDGPSDTWATVGTVRDLLRSVPRNGLGYGLLGVARAGGRSEVSFNYIGQVDRAVDDAGAFGLVAGSAGSESSALMRRPYLLDVNARVAGGRLEMRWTYCRSLHAAERIARLAADALSAVRDVLDIGRRRGPLALRPDDVPLSQLGGTDLRRVAGRFPEASIEDVYPLTPLQHGMWVHSLARPGSGAFVTQIELVIEGDLQPEAFREAWRQLQTRHAVLRTAFTDVGGGAFRQVVLADPPLPWTAVDWSAIDAGDALARRGQLLDAERHRGFGLDEAPMARLVFVAMPGGRFHLVWTHHHALLDGWSVVMLLEELVQLYEARLEGREPDLEPRPGYREYIAWRRTRTAEDARLFWSRFLQGVTSPTRLAADAAPRLPAGERSPMFEQERWIDPSTTRAIAEAAARHRLTLNTVVQGAWALLLSRYSGDRDVVFGTAVSGRPAELPGVERMIGLFLNGVPMRARVDGAAPLASWLQGLQRAHVEVRQHEHDGLDEIRGWIELAPGEPIFETTVAFENYPVAATLEPATRRMGIVDFRLTAHTSAALHLRVVPGERVRLMLSHAVRRFDEPTAAEMLAQIERVLQQFAAHPEMRVDEVTLGATGAGEAEPIDPARGAGRMIASDGTRRAGASPAPAAWTRGAVHEQILERARASAGRVAMVEPSGALTYAELDARTNAVAHALAAAGVGRGEPVGVHVPRGGDLIVALLGVLRAGAAFTILDPDYPWARLREQVETAGVRIVLTAGRERETARAVERWSEESVARRLMRVGDECSAQHAFPVCVPAGADDLAYVAFTSGSTGRPRAILGRHAALPAYATWLADRFGLGENDRVSVLTALSHDPLLRDVFPSLQLGATLCIPDPGLFERPDALRQWMSSERVTVANLTPAMAQLLLEGATPGCLPDLRLSLFVGEPLAWALLDRWRACAPGTTAVNLYGATETQQALACYVVPRVPAADPQAGAQGSISGPRGTVPVGKGIPGVELRVCAAGRTPAGTGEVGEVWLVSDSLARGYLDDEALTRERFVDDPFGPGTGRAYRTGDRGRLLPTGDLVLMGRTDDLVKIRGFRVEPAEIEAFLARQPDVREAAVTVVSDADGRSALAACVAGPAAASDLRQRLRAQFPEFLVPGRISRLERLPRTATGKVDRRALANLVEDATESGDTCVAARNPVETQLAAIWSEVLGMPRVGIFDSFFEMGGHSIVAARLVSRIREALGVDLRIADVFERPRIAEFAPLVEAGLAAQEEVVRELADEIRGLSPEELQALLDEADGSATSEEEEAPR